MAASSTWSEGALHNVGIQSARCSGFCQIRGEKREFAYVVSVEWTDDRRLFVKRPFGEFQTFHKSLVKTFPALKQVERTKLNLGAGITSGLKDFMTKDKRALAESREILVDTYLRNLLLLPPVITHSSLVLSFFESRKTDPKPCRSHAPSEKSDSGIDLTLDQQQRLGLTPGPDAAVSSHLQTSAPSSDESGSSGTGTRGQRSAGRRKSSDVDDDNVESPDEFSSSEYDGGDSEDGRYRRQRLRSRGKQKVGVRNYGDEDDNVEDIDEDDTSQDYFLDMAISELMLNSASSSMTRASSGIGMATSSMTTGTMDSSSSPTSPESSMWCSTGDTFSQILASSMPHGLPSAGIDDASLQRRRRHLAATMCAVVSDDEEDDDAEAIFKKLNINTRFSDEDEGDSDKDGHTVVGSGGTLNDAQTGGDEWAAEAELESDDEFSMKPLAKPAMGQYYLSVLDVKEDV